MKVGDAIFVGERWQGARFADESGARYGRAVDTGGDIGLSGTPDAGDELVLESEWKAREVVLFARNGLVMRSTRAEAQKRSNAGEYGSGRSFQPQYCFKQTFVGRSKPCQLLYKLATDEVRVNLIAQGVGGITNPMRL